MQRPKYKAYASCGSQAPHTLFQRLVSMLLSTCELRTSSEQTADLTSQLRQGNKTACKLVLKCTQDEAEQQKARGGA